MHARSYPAEVLHGGAVGGATLGSSEGLDLVPGTLVPLSGVFRNCLTVWWIFNETIKTCTKELSPLLSSSSSISLLLRQQIISTFSVVADWQTVEGPVSCLSVLPLSFCVLSFQSASTDCNLANQVSGFVERVTMGCQAGARSFISAELPGLIGAGERNMADDGRVRRWRWEDRLELCVGENFGLHLWASWRI